MISVLYESDDRIFIININLMSNLDQPMTWYIEKNEGKPKEYTVRGLEVQVYKNVNKTGATWTDGMLDCYVQGDISDEEVISVIESMYE
jgi:hypothetical protein